MKKYFPVYKFLALRKLLKPKTTNKLSDAYHQFFNKFVEPYEAAQPKIVNPYEGLDKVVYENQMAYLYAGNPYLKETIDLSKSFGNYFVDIDGNTVLDMHMNDGKNFLGYNHRKIIKEANLETYERHIVQSLASGTNPSMDYAKRLHELVRAVAPNELSDVSLTSSGTLANENAIAIALLNKYYNLKGNDNLTEEEMISITKGEFPNLSVLAFDGAYHGNSMNTLSLSDIKGSPEARRGLSRHNNWPIAPFPQIKFPYEDNYDYNRKEEQRCLEETEKIIVQHKEKNSPIAALLIEPLQLHSGVRYSSPTFYQNILRICKQHNVISIIDENFTSGWASGRPFMHSMWNSEVSPDIVTFGGRMQVSGLFMKPELRPRQPFELSSTNNGDLLKLAQYGRLYNYVRKTEQLDAHSAQFMQSIKAELLDVYRRVNYKIFNFRGIGKIFAFDVENEVLRDALVMTARTQGFRVNGLAKNTIGFTPSLMFAETHFALFKEFLLSYRPEILLKQ